MDDIKVKFQVEKPVVQGSYNAHSRYALFLIEQLIVILIFALCAAICVSIFADSYLMAGHTNDMNYGMIMAESGAEAFKAVGDDTEGLARLLNGTDYGDAVQVYYCSNWRITTASSAAYIMYLTVYPGDFGLLYCDVTVYKLGYDVVDGSDTEIIISLTAAWRRD